MIVFQPKLVGIATLAGLGLLVGTHWFAYSLGGDRVSARWAQEQAKRAQEHAKEVEEYRSKEQALQKLLDDSVRSNRNEVSRIARERDAALRSLRDRPIFRAPSPPPTEGARPEAGCTGSGLARPDAEFLVGYAADAARLAGALKQCLDSYVEVQRTMNAGSR